MALESITNTVAAYGTEAIRQSAKPATVKNTSTNVNITNAGTQNIEPMQTAAVASVNNDGDGQQDAATEQGQQGQQMSQKFVSEAVNNANSRMTRTKCEFSYDETTKRVSITIRDNDTDEVIKEIPPKEALEMVAKMWELAGILVDEKR